MLGGSNPSEHFFSNSLKHIKTTIKITCVKKYNEFKNTTNVIEKNIFEQIKEKTLTPMKQWYTIKAHTEKRKNQNKERKNHATR